MEKSDFLKQLEFQDKYLEYLEEKIRSDKVIEGVLKDINSDIARLADAAEFKAEPEKEVQPNKVVHLNTFVYGKKFVLCGATSTDRMPDSTIDFKDVTCLECREKIRRKIMGI